jgi:hypothetical protein
MKGELLEETECERIRVNIHENIKPSAQNATAVQVAIGVFSQIIKAFHYRDQKT